MKILSITTQKPDSTGSGVYLTGMVKAFDALGHKQVVIAGVAPGDAPVFPQGVQFAGVHYESAALPFPVVGMSDEMPYHATRYRDMSPDMAEQLKSAFQQAALQQIAVFDPDIVICHHLYLMTACVREVVTDRPVVGVCHGTDLRQMRQHLFERDYIRQHIQTLDCLCALHEEQRLEIAEIFEVKAQKVQVIGTGYDRSLFNPFGRISPSQEGKVRLLYVGKIWVKKGVEALIHALDLLPYSRDELQLELIGGHSHEQELDAMQEAAKHARYPIVFRGKQPLSEVAQAYRRSELFVLPSFFEGLPLVVIEALACGCKVVLTDLPGIRDWISSYIPDAPIWYVSPPQMDNIDEPLPEALPSFEKELARTIEKALKEEYKIPDMEGIAWTALCQKVLAALP